VLIDRSPGTLDLLIGCFEELEVGWSRAEERVVILEVLGFVFFFFLLLFLALIGGVSYTSSSLYQCFDMAVTVFLLCPSYCVYLAPPH
jgi:hypothetical protein